MAWLDKSKTLFPRNERGELLPVEVELPLPDKPKILVLPISRGKFAEIYSSAKEGSGLVQDDQIILEHCIEPKFSIEEIKALKPHYVVSIVSAIISTSLGKDETAEKSEDELKKNLTAEKVT